jgi:hypothetical protein
MIYALIHRVRFRIDYAAAKDVKLLGYVYPCLDFTGGSKVPEANDGGSMDLSNMKFQVCFLKTSGLEREESTLPLADFE